MKPMKFFHFEKDYLSRKTFPNIEKNLQSSKILIVSSESEVPTFYDRLDGPTVDQSINCSIGIIIKINLEKALKLNSSFYEKVVLIHYGLHDDLKLYDKKLTAILDMSMDRSSDNLKNGIFLICDQFGVALSPFIATRHPISSISFRSLIF